LDCPPACTTYLGSDNNNVAPRFGFAYQIAQNTVVRGAFGIFVESLAELVFYRKIVLLGVRRYGLASVEKPMQVVR
jgi:hypothetical protein